MNHPWQELILSLAGDLDRAGVPYSFEASTAMLIQGLELPGMDDIDLSVEWGYLETARTLFAPYSPTPITHYDGWATFRFERVVVPIDVLSYHGTVMANDPDRLVVAHAGRSLWCKSLGFFHRHAPVGHPRRQLIEAFWASQDQSPG